MSGHTHSTPSKAEPAPLSTPQLGNHPDDMQSLYGNSFAQAVMLDELNPYTGELAQTPSPAAPTELDERNPYTGALSPLAPRSTRLEIDELNPYAPAPAPAPRLTAPTRLDGPLGPMTVYPDGYTGTLPKGAVRQSEHEKMEGIITKIEDSTSQLTFDTSNFTEGLDPVQDPEGYAKALAEGEAFRKQYMGYLKDLVKTPTGLKLLDELGHSKHKTKIIRGPVNSCSEPNTPDTELVPRTDGMGKVLGTHSGAGASPTITLNPKEKSLFVPGREVEEEPWQTEVPRYGFYHELVHAYHSTRGDAIAGTEYGGRALTEYQTVGRATSDKAKTYDAGSYPDEEVSDNAIRREMGKDERLYY